MPISGKNRILVIEQDDAVLKFLVRCLKKAGYLADGTPACGVFLHDSGVRRYALVLASLSSLGPSPFDAVARIKRDGVPLLLMTGGSELALIAKAVLLGAQGPLQKPFGRESLLATIQDILG